jgi:hypothetical protein
MGKSEDLERKARFFARGRAKNAPIFSFFVDNENFFKKNHFFLFCVQSSR